MQVSIPLTRRELPASVERTITEAARGGKVRRLDRLDLHAVAVLSRLEAPQTAYTAEMIRDDERMELKFAEDGTILGTKLEDDDEDDDD